MVKELPFNIPQSLRSYVERFNDEPERSIEKLKKHVRRRDPDAVGHFLLAWFHHLQDQPKEAIREALIAKTYAPGSPLMEHLHYFLVHPELFEAAIPRSSYADTPKFSQANRSAPKLDLDRLIEMLEAVEAHRITIPQDDDTEMEDLSQDAEIVDDIISETLARIHVNQGNKKEAIKMYERLVVLNEDKADHYNKEIKKLKKK